MGATTFKLVWGKGKASISERRVKNDWVTGEACCIIIFDLLATVEGLKVGTVSNFSIDVVKGISWEFRNALERCMAKEVTGDDSSRLFKNGIMEDFP